LKERGSARVHRHSSEGKKLSRRVQDLENDGKKNASGTEEIGGEGEKKKARCAWWEKHIWRTR